MKSQPKARYGVKQLQPRKAFVEKKIGNQGLSIT